MVSAVSSIVRHDQDPNWYIHDSAIYCSSGAQAAKRAAEGFDMVSSLLLARTLACWY